MNDRRDALPRGSAFCVVLSRLESALAMKVLADCGHQGVVLAGRWIGFTKRYDFTIPPGVELE